MRSEARAAVFMSCGLWVAKCPRTGCMNAETMGLCLDGTTGGLDGSRFYCRESHGGCGLTCAADWPANVHDIERVVLCRPVPTTRNWLPGEDLHDLLQENLSHGLVPAEALNDGPTRPVLGIYDNEITAGSLDWAQRPQLEEGH